MRRFYSYGPLDTEEHFYAPRSELIQNLYTQLMGYNPQKGGHYITVWAPRQTGKSWLMQQALTQIKKNNQFDALKINLESLKYETDVNKIENKLAKKIGDALGKKFDQINDQDDFQEIFKRGNLDKPLILILDEFDSLSEQAINSIVSVFRNVYNNRLDEMGKPTEEKTYLLHAVALVGIRSVLGVENEKGSPFNVQHSIQIPNLTSEEVTEMFLWYQKESSQKIEAEVIQKLTNLTRGQPGLTSWFGELITDTFNHQKDKPITMINFEEVYGAAINTLPNNNIQNIISKVEESPYRERILELFKTEEKISFKFDNKETNFLYLNGIIDVEKAGHADYYVRFSSPFVQNRLFNYFSNELFEYMGQLIEPFEKLDDIINESGIQIRNLMHCYSKYLKKNQDWLLKDAPRRKDLRIFEAVYHFSLYMYLTEFLKSRGGRVYPEFPTGNGQVDLVIHYKNKVYALELKSFTHESSYPRALLQAAKYAHNLNLSEIHLVFFVSHINDPIRKRLEKDHLEPETHVTVKPLFLETNT
jgi:hypothetical protein